MTFLTELIRGTGPSAERRRGHGMSLGCSRIPVRSPSTPPLPRILKQQLFHSCGADLNVVAEW